MHLNCALKNEINTGDRFSFDNESFSLFYLERLASSINGGSPFLEAALAKETAREITIILCSFHFIPNLKTGKPLMGIAGDYYKTDENHDSFVILVL
jgi:hypothetical protein